MSLLDIFDISVSAVVSDGKEESMSENESVESGVAPEAVQDEPNVADPDAAAPADSAESAVSADSGEGADVEAVEADGEAVADEEEEVALNEDGAVAIAGELFGGPDANQAVHEVVSEGIGELAEGEEV